MPYRPRTLMMLVLAVFCWGEFAAHAASVRNRSTSRTGQFIVYCDDRELRSRVVGFAEEVKADFLQIRRAADDWSPQRPPIVITIDPADPAQAIPPVQVRWMNTVAGAKIDVIVRIGNDPAEIFLQRHLLRAVLLELSYRERPAPTGNQPVVNPPWWVVEGMIEALRVRNGTEGLEVYKSILQSERIPTLDGFLSQAPAHLDTAAGDVDRACAMCLVEALLGLPNGGANLLRFLQAWPDAGGDVVGALASQFPSLAGSGQSLTKWWTLQIARFAGGDRLSGMSLADTDRDLTNLLRLEIPVDKAGRLQTYDLAKFESYLKLPAARAVLQTQRVKLVALMVKAHPLFRPVLAEYEQIMSLLSARKSRRISERVAAIEQYRQTIMQQMGQITDYLNWYEATQPVGRTGAFDHFIRRAERLTAQPPVDPRISEYLDRLEADFAPIAPNAWPGLTPTGAASR